ncbi:MAG: hypothetical protein JO145_09520 [Acidobacteriaceae bacterium]|nr:hypothetical protein [Acidobacteriaceae bacterium]
MLGLMAGTLSAQQAPPDALARILDRLDALERQNQALISEVQALREELEKSKPAVSSENQNLEDRVDVAEQRIKEHAQTKVESSQRFPLTLNGMLLFDAFLNAGQQTYGGPYGYAQQDSASAGATLGQSILGLDFRGPLLPGGGQVHGSLSMDFYSRAGGYDIFRLRQGTVSFDWKRRSITFGQDKSLIAPLQPTSFARVGIPPLDGAGNLWLWRPQVRYEERIPLPANTQASLQIGILQTDESYLTPILPAYALPIQPSRPAFQARVAVAHQWGDQSRFAASLGFHSSSTHVLGESIDSRVVSADFVVKPLPQLELSGTVFRGENFSNIGGGSPGVTVTDDDTVIPVRGAGGWLQIALPVTPRLTFDLYAGRQLNNARDLLPYEIARTLTYASNVLYRISPNVVLGLEASQSRLDYLQEHQVLSNRYDATVAYLF